MNHLQAKALADLMSWARPWKRFNDGPEPDVHCSLEVVDGGEEYEVRLFTTTTALDRFPSAFYLRADGTIYKYDADTDTEETVVPSSLRWMPHPTRKHYRELVCG